MPRHIAKESDDEFEPKTGRKTRAVLSASGTTDSPVRRSTRIRHSSVNPDGSSPESVTDAAMPQVTSIVTRRRAAAAAAVTANSTNAPENNRRLRSRKNSVSSNISDNLDNESVPGTPKTRTTKQLSSLESTPQTPQQGPKTRRSMRALSETKSPPPPVVRGIRRTRAGSVEPESKTERAVIVSTPTKKRRQQASVRPTEPVVTEEANEDIDDPDMIREFFPEETDNENNSEQTLESSQRSLSYTPQKSSKGAMTKEHTDSEIEAHESFGEKYSEVSPAKEVSPTKDKFETEVPERSVQIISQVHIKIVNDSTPDNIEAQNSIIPVQSPMTKTKRNSLDKSKELGMKIEDLLNKSAEEQEKSPGNKENEKLNVSPEKVKKSLEFNVSSFNVARGKSLGSIKTSNRSGDKKINTSLDERVLSKSPYNIIPSKSTYVDSNKIIAEQNSHGSDTEKQSETELSGVVKSAEKKQKERLQVADDEGEQSNLKTTYTKVDETVVENEIIEEFTLHDFNDDDSKNEFCLVVEDDIDIQKKKDDSMTKSMQTETYKNVDSEEESSTSNDIFNKPNPSRNSSRQSTGDDIQEQSHTSPKRQFSFDTKQRRRSLEISDSATKGHGKKKSTESHEIDLIDFVSEDTITNSPQIVKNSNNNGNEEESMETNEHKDNKINKISRKISPRKQSVYRIVLSEDDENTSLNTENTERKTNNQEADSDSNIVINDLFHDISAEEWNQRQKSDSHQKEKKKRRRSSSKNTENTEYDSNNDLIQVREKSLKEIETENHDNDDTVISKQNDSIEKANKKRRSSIKIIPEDTERENDELEESPKQRKTPKKNKKSNTPSSENETNDLIGEKKHEVSDKEDSKIDNDSTEEEIVPQVIDNPTEKNKTHSDSENVGEKQPMSLKNTPKVKKQKSPVKSATKSKKSSGAYELEDSLEEGQDYETTIFVDKKAKSQQEQASDSALVLKIPKAPMNKDYSMLAVVDSDSGPENITDLDGPGSDNDNEISSNFLLNIASSDDETDNSDSDEDKSKNTIDSDIAREMNLAGNDNIQYSDDDIPGDDCCGSESEHSDENDNGSDIGDFIVADNDVESSEESEEEEEPMPRFRRILDQALSEDEKEEQEEIDENDKEIEVKRRHEKEKRMSLPETPDSNASLLLNKGSGRKSNVSIDSGKSSSSKKTKKGKLVPDSGESELLLSSSIENLEKGSKKKSKKLTNPIKQLLDTTIDLCTPEGNTMFQTPDISTSIANNKSAKKLKKNLIEDLGDSTPDRANLIEGSGGKESVLTHKTKTPNKEKKTPKSAKKSQRDSVMLIEEVALVKPNISDANKSMSTPNSESPVTKFLKKERLNESLPLLEQKKRISKSFDKKALSNMEEDEQEENDDSEMDEEKNLPEESENEESEENDNIEENGDVVNGNGDRDDDENEDETDEESDGQDENGDVDDENESENEPEKEGYEESSEEELSVRKNKKARNEKIEQTGIQRIKESKKSKAKKSVTAEPEVQDIIPSKKRLSKSKTIASPSNVVNRINTESDKVDKTPSKKYLTNTEVEPTNKRKRAGLESGETPQSSENTKKIKIAAKVDVSVQNESDSDEAPDSLGFGEARTEALQSMKDVLTSLKAAKEAKKQKKLDQLERMRKEKEAKANKKSTRQAKTIFEPVKNNLKRLPEDFLENLNDVPERPKKKRKLVKNEEEIVPSKYMFSPGKSPKSSVEIVDCDSPVSSSTGGATTHFSVINLKKVKKQPTKAAMVASFRDTMLARNPRQPVSAFLMYQAKQKASGKQLPFRK